MGPDAVAVVAPVTSAENLARAKEQGVDVAAVDAALSQVAASRPHAELRQVVAHYLARLDPDGIEPDPTESRALVTARDSKGMVTGRFVLDAIGGEKVLAAIASILQASRPAGDTRTEPSSPPMHWCSWPTTRWLRDPCRRCAGTSRMWS